VSIDNKQLAVFTGVKRSFNALGNEHLEPLGNEHTLACNTDNNGDVPVEPRSGGDAGIKSIVKRAKLVPRQCTKECTVCIRKEEKEDQLDCVYCVAQSKAKQQQEAKAKQQQSPFSNSMTQDDRCKIAEAEGAK